MTTFEVRLAHGAVYKIEAGYIEVGNGQFVTMQAKSQIVAVFNAREVVSIIWVPKDSTV